MLNSFFDLLILLDFFNLEVKFLFLYFKLFKFILIFILYIIDYIIFMLHFFLYFYIYSLFICYNFKFFSYVAALLDLVKILYCFFLCIFFLIQFNICIIYIFNVLIFLNFF